MLELLLTNFKQFNQKTNSDSNNNGNNLSNNTGMEKEVEFIPNDMLVDEEIPIADKEDDDEDLENEDVEKVENTEKK